MNYEQQYPEVEKFVDWSNPEPSDPNPDPSDPQKSNANSGSLGMSPEPKGGTFSNKGRLRADLYTAFDKLPFNPNDHLRFGREWDQPSDEQKWMAGLLGIKDPKKLNVYNSPESYFLTRAVQDWNAKKAGMSMSFFEPSDPRMNDDLMKYVIDAEGDKAENHRFDFGKSTKYGISTKDKERLAKYGLSIGDIPNLSYLQAKQFYKDEYWNKPYTVGLPPPKDVQNKRLAIVLFDTAINGVGPIGPPLRSIYNDTTLTDDQKADAMMTLRLKFYKKYGQAFGRTPEEKAKNLAMAQIGWHNRIIKKLWPYVGHDPDKVQQ